MYVAGKSQQATDALSRKKNFCSSKRVQIADCSEDLGSKFSASLAALVSSLDGSVTEPRVITLDQLQQEYEPRQEWSLLPEDRERAFAKKLYNDGTRLAIGTRKMPPLSQRSTGEMACICW